MCPQASTLSTSPSQSKTEEPLRSLPAPVGARELAPRVSQGKAEPPAQPVGRAIELV